MISSALYRFFGMVQISYIGFLPLSIWTRNFRLGQNLKGFNVSYAIGLILITADTKLNANADLIINSINLNKFYLSLGAII